jgi:multidrug efflux pump subunit AcrA (membrane-fusion protein)
MFSSNKSIVIGTVFAVVVGGFVGLQFFGENVLPDSISSSLRIVSVAQVGALNKNIPALPTVGTVESETQVTLRAETSGEVRAVYIREGNFVARGTLIAELKNDSERARLSQVEAGVLSAEAGLAKAQKGARGEDISILEARVSKETKSLAETKELVITTLKTAYANIEGAILGNADQMFSNPRGSEPQLSFSSAQEAQVEWERYLIGQSLDVWDVELLNATPVGDLDALLDSANTVVTEARDFITDLSAEVNNVESSAYLSQTMLISWKTALVTAQGSITGTISTLSGVRDKLTAQVSALAIAETELSRGAGGERSEDVVVADARLKQAEASVDEARAQLSKTQIRTPIAGTVNELSIERGDFVSAFSDVGVVSNNTALQIKTFITEDERQFVVLGASVQIDDVYTGDVISIAPALDSSTKKIEVLVSVPQNIVLTNGESVRLLISRGESVVESENRITLPLSAIKILPQDTIIFTIDENDTLVAHPVTLGPIVGSEVVILSGITPEMTIVLDARGLREGEIVTQ